MIPDIALGIVLGVVMLVFAFVFLPGVLAVVIALAYPFVGNSPDAVARRTARTPRRHRPGGVWLYNGTPALKEETRAKTRQGLSLHLTPQRTPGKSRTH
jgi:hypothetical protein